MMQAAAWVVHSVSDPYARGKDFYYVSVLLLAVCLIAGVLATAATAHREGDGQGWKAALLIALSPGLILAAYINWDLFAMALDRGRPRRLGGAAAVAGRGAARPRGRDEVLPAADLRRAAAAVPARGKDARVRQGARGRG